MIQTQEKKMVQHVVEHFYHWNVTRNIDGMNNILNVSSQFEEQIFKKKNAQRRNNSSNND